MRASSSRTPSRKEESERYTATLRRRCIARAQDARQALLSRQRGISDGLDASAVARDIISAELREASCAGWARRGPSQDGEPDPHADLDFEAYAELLAATEQSLLAELREDVASLDGPGGEEYEAFLDWAAQGDEARLREAADEADGGGASVLCPLCERGALLHTADGWVVCNRRRRRLRAPAVGRGPPRPSSSFANGWRRSSRSTASPVAGARAAGCRRSSRRRAASSCRARRAGRT